MKNQLIIFSKNRASQLNLLLDSIHKNANNIFDKINVIYKADGDFQKAYDILSESQTSINFIKETNFQKDTISAIDEQYKYTTFLVDDDVFYDNVNTNIDDIISILNNTKSLCFSFRLGLNSTYCHPANLHYKIGEYIEIGDYICFNYDKQKGDLAYPLSVDGHIFRTDEIKNLIINISFVNPNTLEARLQHYHNTPKLSSSFMCSFNKSKLVGVPVNLVNDTYKNRHGLTHFISETELNKRYLNGERISLEDIDFGEVNGPHKEVKYEFKKIN